MKIMEHGSNWNKLESSGLMQIESIRRVSRESHCNYPWIFIVSEFKEGALNYFYFLCFEWRLVWKYSKHIFWVSFYKFRICFIPIFQNSFFFPNLFFNHTFYRTQTFYQLFNHYTLLNYKIKNQNQSYFKKHILKNNKPNKFWVFYEIEISKLNILFSF